jgi:hypothetical protein
MATGKLTTHSQLCVCQWFSIGRPKIAAYQTLSLLPITTITKYETKLFSV